MTIYEEHNDDTRETWTVDGSFAEALDWHKTRGQAILDAGFQVGENSITEQDGRSWRIDFQKVNA